MIVGRREANRIFDGRKVQHRLPRERSAPEVGRVVPISFREPNAALGFDRDGTPREDTVRACYVSILERRESTVFAATDDDAVAEGYRSREELLDDWSRADRPVWVVRFMLDTRHRPRLLAAQVVAGRQGAYTDNPARALADEPEAVDPFTQARITAEARSRDRERARLRRDLVEQLPFDLRLAYYTREARERHIDIRDELRAIRRWNDPEARERQLDKIQAKVERPLPVAL